MTEETAKQAPRPNRSLQAKSSARLVAVQLLYQAAVTGAKLNPATLTEQYNALVEESVGNPKEAALPAVPPDKAFLRKLLQGVTEHGERLEPLVERVLTEDWKKERTSPLLMSILRAAAFELAEGKLPIAVLVDEYVTLTNRFFSSAETGFMQAALHALARSLNAA